MRKIGIGAFFLSLAAFLAPLAVTPARAAALDPQSGQGRAENAGKMLVGRPGPAVRVRTIDGQTIDLTKLYGKKPVYLKFWATWCVPCREQMPGFEHDYESLGDKMQVVAIDVGFNDSVERVKALRAQLGLKMPIVFDDGALGGRFNLRVTPQHVVIGRDGKILYVGHLEDQELHQAFAQAIAEPGSKDARTTAATAPAVKPGETPHGFGAGAALAAFEGPTADPKPRLIAFVWPSCEPYLAQSEPERSRKCRLMREAVDKAVRAGEVRAVSVADGIWASQEDVDDYRRKTAATTPVVLDASGRVFRAFAVHETPTVILLDAQGRVAKRLSDGNALEAAIQSMKGTL